MQLDAGWSGAMDVLFFLKERTRFIRRFDEVAGEPFRETIRKIDARKSPFVRKYGEATEPPFLDEWLEADTGLQVVRQTCVSMLSEALKLYFKTWESQLGAKCPQLERRKYFEKGFVRGYQRLFGDSLGLPWNECPTDFDILEQVALARNAAQHPDEIAMVLAKHDLATKTQFPSPFFAHDSERHLFAADDPLSDWFLAGLHVSGDKLLAAIEQVELLADWLDNRMLLAKHSETT